MTSGALTTSDVVRQSLTTKGVDRRGTLLSGALLVGLLIVLGTLAVLIGDILIQGWATLTSRGAEFATGALNPDPALAGVGQGVVGSILLMVMVIVVSFPLGIGAAIYVEEYARDTRLTRVLTANIRNLAGVPSIVFGLLGLAVFVKVMAGVTGGRTVIAGGLTLAVLVLPIMVITASEALRAVPQELRQAAYGVGATRWEVVRHHVLPVAAPAIFTGAVLTIARAFGESAPLLLAGAIVGNFLSNGDMGIGQQLTEGKYTALPIIVFNWARQPQREFQEITAAAIIVLLVLLFIVNGAAIVLRDRFERRSMYG